MKNLNVLIIEDESLLALNLAAKLQKLGVRFVDFVCTYDEVFETLEKNSDINLLIVDINLNDTASGIDLVTSLNSPIDAIYLTAYSNDKTILSATKTLPLGYLIKPVDMKQLHILLQIASEKIALEMTNLNIFDLSHGYIFDYNKNSIIYREIAMKISGKKLKLLKMLIEKNGKFLSFEEAEKRLYQSHSPSDSALRTLIYRLRAHFNFDLIETEKFHGVRLVLPDSN
jgi:DNA-binding response OmpR family regulator